MTDKPQNIFKALVPYLSAALLALLLFLFFMAGLWVGYLKYRPAQNEPKSMVVEVPDAVTEDENVYTDDIGDFILHHEYFAADPEVLEEVELPNEIVSSEGIKASISPQDVKRLMSEINRQSDFQAGKVILDKISVAKPMLAIVVDDMGINHKRTEDIISLKAPLTSSFLTYGSNLAEFAEEAKESGHEIMIHVPMEPKVKADLAPDTMLTSMNEEEIRTLFEQMLAKFADIKVSGINNHMGSKFTEDKEKLGIVMDELKEKDMFFLDSKTTASSKGRELALEDKVDYAGRDVFLDNENDYDYIMKQLSTAERIAQSKGFAIAICHPKSQTYLVLRDWLAGLPQKSVELVPLSRIVKEINR